jgi:hypothetical protein
MTCRRSQQQLNRNPTSRHISINSMPGVQQHSSRVSWYIGCQMQLLLLASHQMSCQTMTQPLLVLLLLLAIMSSWI